MKHLISIIVSDESGISEVFLNGRLFSGTSTPLSSEPLLELDWTLQSIIEQAFQEIYSKKSK